MVDVGESDRWLAVEVEREQWKMTRECSLLVFKLYQDVEIAFRVFEANNLTSRSVLHELRRKQEEFRNAIERKHEPQPEEVRSDKSHRVESPSPVQQQHGEVTVVVQRKGPNETYPSSPTKFPRVKATKAKSQKSTTVQLPVRKSTGNQRQPVKPPVVVVTSATQIPSSGSKKKVTLEQILERAKLARTISTGIAKPTAQAVRAEEELQIQQFLPASTQPSPLPAEEATLAQPPLLREVETPVDLLSNAMNLFTKSMRHMHKSRAVAVERSQKFTRTLSEMFNVGMIVSGTPSFTQQYEDELSSVLFKGEDRQVKKQPTFDHPCLHIPNTMLTRWLPKSVNKQVCQELLFPPKQSLQMGSSPLEQPKLVCHSLHELQQLYLRRHEIQHLLLLEYIESKIATHFIPLLQRMQNCHQPSNNFMKLWKWLYRLLMKQGNGSVSFVAVE